ncbi:hypothetical protein AWV79_24325 [Cupriavidus sp. UYMMa02A]|nr:hypothetical protein AWV79_24325 [Cupriavidus sp. UYMMa02A]
MELAFRDEPDIEAFAQFNLGGRHLIDFCDLRARGPYQIPATMIPVINFHLTRQVCVIARR